MAEVGDIADVLRIIVAGFHPVGERLGVLTKAEQYVDALFAVMRFCLGRGGGKACEAQREGCGGGCLGSQSSIGAGGFPFRGGFLCAMGAGPCETDHEEGQKRIHEVIETEIFVETRGKALAGFR